MFEQSAEELTSWMDKFIRPDRIKHKQEYWLIKNKEALASVMKGLKQSKEGKVREIEL